ncbi:response regulator transcription factor [Achromobacter marplatensis]|uniref:LuxR family two component transcriptional regulator n=1 Tax=Achromobacter marplatensis TaxID=470868 RepID=A0ABX9GH03_9BURK|nr:LuxR family two component transcriptional regulator [Achromobacter marplatensis]CAB3657505.1 Transcriptional regulatory protein RcsB [Achromobacter marplatensis]
MSNTFASSVRVAILDDHAVVRNGLVAHLQSEIGIEITGVYNSSRAMIAGVVQSPADVLLIDYALGPDDMDGVALIRALRLRFPSSHIIVLSAHNEPATVALVLRAGVRGFVSKTQDMAEIARAIRVVASGAVFLEAQMTFRLADATTNHVPVQSDESGDAVYGAALSAREREVIRCFLDGMTVTQIAEKFNRSIKTISSQKAAAFRKLGVTSNNGLFKVRHIIDSL